MWVDCSEVTSSSYEFVKQLEEKAGLMVNPGKDFGGNGDTFVRVNLACPETYLKDGLNRLKEGVR